MRPIIRIDSEEQTFILHVLRTRYDKGPSTKFHLKMPRNEHKKEKNKRRRKKSRTDEASIGSNRWRAIRLVLPVFFSVLIMSFERMVDSFGPEEPTSNWNRSKSQVLIPVITIGQNKKKLK